MRRQLKDLLGAQFIWFTDVCTRTQWRPGTMTWFYSQKQLGQAGRLGTPVAGSLGGALLSIVSLIDVEM